MENEQLPVRITPDLRIEVDQPGEPLSPQQALRFAEAVTLRAMMRQAALAPPRRIRALRTRRTGSL